MAMKQGRSLQDLAQTLKSVRDSTRDYVVPAGALYANVSPGGANPITMSFRVDGEERSFALNPWSAGQLASYADIPKAYFDRIVKENAILASDSVNHGIGRQSDDRRLIRTNGSNLRALLSPKYRRLDSADLADAVLPTLLNAGMEVVSSDLTERRFYLRATTPRLQSEVAKGDVVQAGIMISNSDVGAGSFRVEPFLVRLVCLNGMVREHAFRKTHLGRSLAVGDDSVELLREETLRLGEKAFWAEVNDIVAASLLPEVFEREVDKLRETTTRTLKNFDLEAVVDVTMKTVGLGGNRTLSGSILDALAAGGQGAGLTQWGLANAFSAVANQDEVSFDQAVELERASGAVIDLNPSQWAHIADKPR